MKTRAKLVRKNPKEKQARIAKRSRGIKHTIKTIFQHIERDSKLVGNLVIWKVKIPDLAEVTNKRADQIMDLLRRLNKLSVIHYHRRIKRGVVVYIVGVRKIKRSLFFFKACQNEIKSFPFRNYKQNKSLAKQAYKSLIIYFSMMETLLKFHDRERLSCLGFMSNWVEQIKNNLKTYMYKVKKQKGGLPKELEQLKQISKEQSLILISKIGVELEKLQVSKAHTRVILYSCAEAVAFDRRKLSKLLNIKGGHDTLPKHTARQLLLEYNNSITRFYNVSRLQKRRVPNLTENIVNGLKSVKDLALSYKIKQSDLFLMAVAYWRHVIDTNRLPPLYWMSQDKFQTLVWDIAEIVHDWKVFDAERTERQTKLWNRFISVADRVFNTRMCHYKSRHLVMFNNGCLLRSVRTYQKVRPEFEYRSGLMMTRKFFLSAQRDYINDHARYKDLRHLYGDPAAERARNWVRQFEPYTTISPTRRAKLQTVFGKKNKKEVT